MYHSERCDRLLSLLNSKKHMSVKDLCTALYCSVSTLRRDLIELEKDGLVKRSHGGASIVSGANIEYSSSFRESEHIREKEYLCSLARDFLSNGMAIFLDSSSTVIKLCPILEQFSNITVVTNNIRAALALNESDRVDTFITGGHLKTGSSSIVGELAGSSIDGFKADIAFLSCRGVDQFGLYEANQEQAWVKQHMIQNCKSAVLLCDSSKFGHSYFYKLGSFRQIDAVITDRIPEEDMIYALMESQCDLLY